MKKTALILLAIALVLTGCRVGPAEGKDIPAPETQATADAVPESIPIASIEAPEPLPEQEIPDEIYEPVTDEAEVGREDVAVILEEADRPDYDFDVDYYAAAEMIFAEGSVNVREGPSVDYTAIDQLTKDEAVYCFGEAETGWLMISVGEGYGFVSPDYFSDLGDIGQPDPLDSAMKETVIEDFIDEYEADGAVLSGYYGEADAGLIVAISSGEEALEDPAVFGMIRLYRPEANAEFYVYRRGRFTLLSEAYDDGDVTDREIAAAEEFSRLYPIEPYRSES